jgi:hypothetical protein
VYPYIGRGWRAKRAGVGKTCTDGKSVCADRRLRTDDEAIRAQSTIFVEPIFRILKNPVRCTDGVYPYIGRGWRAERAGVGKACTDGKSVRADRRLRTDNEAIRAQSTIFVEPIFRILKNPVRCTDGVYPYIGRGWRAERAGDGKTRTQSTIFKEPFSSC